MSRFLRVKVVRANLSHTRHVAWKMRRADIDEIWAAARINPYHALELPFFTPGAETYTILDDETPVAMGGIVNLASGVADVWALGTDWIDSHPVAFTKAAKTLLADFRERFHLLQNFVDDRNEKAKRWLDRMGFVLRDPAPHGPMQLPFRYFFLMGES